MVLIPCSSGFSLVVFRYNKPADYLRKKLLSENTKSVIWDTFYEIMIFVTKGAIV